MRLFGGYNPGKESEDPGKGSAADGSLRYVSACISKALSTFLFPLFRLWFSVHQLRCLQEVIATGDLSIAGFTTI